MASRELKARYCYNLNFEALYKVTIIRDTRKVPKKVAKTLTVRPK